MFKPEDVDKVSIEPFEADNLKEEFCKVWNGGKAFTALAKRLKNPFLKAACHFLALVGNSIADKCCSTHGLQDAP